MELTREQQAIIDHPIGSHARVLAVAGSGKTTTMVQRVRHLVLDLGADPKNIRVVMFNRLARESFEKKLSEALPDGSRRPKVSTFHSLAYSLILAVQKQGLIDKNAREWIGNTEELARVCAHRAMDGLIREGLLDQEVDSGDVLSAIGQWKASLIPPERAGHRTNPDMPLIYKRFEELRKEANAITFDDFVPIGMDILTQNETLRRQWANKLDHLIVDEYQDINYGQQQLIRVLAGTRADVMVVGDDDQTIYEFRAARPHYILQGFKADFSNKPVADYQLSHAFRFGPLIAQTAYNVISFNRQREPKALVAHTPLQETGITLYTDVSEQSAQISQTMVDEIIALVRQRQVKPEAIAVLGRTFAQMEGLQMMCLQRRIPYRVLGMAPFFERDENRTLIDYIRLALAWDEPANMLRPWRVPVGLNDDPEEAVAGQYQPYTLAHDTPTAEAVRIVLAVANTPFRKLSRDILSRAVERGYAGGLSLGETLLKLHETNDSALPGERRDAMRELTDILRRIRERVLTETMPKLAAADLLAWLVDSVGYYEHFQKYYGSEAASGDRINSVKNFLLYATLVGKPVVEFIDHLKSLDTTLGLPTNQVITFTTIHRTKGLEFDYVFIPNCVEGSMPVHYTTDLATYDITGQTPDPPASSGLESERRLFYVAVTRAIRHLYIGTIEPPVLGLQGASSTALPSRFLDEMRLEPSRMAIGVVRQSLGEGKDWDTALAGVAVQLSGHRRLVQSVLAHYSPFQLSQRLPEKLASVLNGVSEVPFQYSFEYAIVTQVMQKPAPGPRIWKDPWASIGSGV